MTEAQAYALLTEILRAVFERPDIAAEPGMRASDVVGWDSFKQVEILLMLEERLDVVFRPGELQALEDVGDLARLVLSHAATQV